MQTLPFSEAYRIFAPLNAWFRYQHNTGDGYERLRQFLQSKAEDQHEIKPSFAEVNYHPLNSFEEERWKHLERKAKQDNLTGYDAIEHDILLEIKLYQHIKKQEEHLTHQQVMDIIRQSL